ncbi:uncharacterized protein [Spinacia oleracea]|uniref:DUF4283 domain-containing protein n=1 Tax=Spinacia oleracea TaxID=3562 RepID=A0ABM3RFT5_SPIOL|nr:uncharacterized protein LOC130469332 [Spinacia oleracea]
MGNFFAACAVGGGSTSSKQDEVLQVMKVNDGKLLEFRAPIKVKDLLKNYPNFYVGIFKEATQPLPLEYKLKIGKIYYLLPCFIATIPNPRNGVVRIKMVITKKQLRQLLSNHTVKIDTILLDIGKKLCSPISMSLPRMQKLHPIGEESE